MRFILFIACLIFCTAQVKSQVYKDAGRSVEDRVNSLLGKMTTEEKLAYIGGINDFYIRGIERLGLPKIKMSDGPVGVRTYGKTVAYPATILAAASWDTALIHRMGVALGEDARARGVHILLAPGVNIFRASMNGRNFEYLGEDPYLASRLAVNYITGVQSKGVVATVKHFAGNNQEWDRHHVSSDIDERTLQEIYLPAFKAAVTEANVGAVMNSYNLVNGVHATENAYLNIDILKKSWGFTGILMSDWESVYDGIAAARNGLDLEMPSAKFMQPDTLAAAMKAGTVTMDMIDDKVRRILRIIYSYGFYDHPQTDATIPLDNPAHDKAALDAALGGIVLLKNNDNILPVKTNKIKTIAVIGPNADAYVAGGGSSTATPFHSVSLLQGLKAEMGQLVKIVYVPGYRDVSNAAKGSVYYASESNAQKGLKAEYFNNTDLSGTPVATRIEAKVDNLWKEAPGVGSLPADHFSIRYTGFVRPLKSGNIRFSVKGDDGYRLWVNDKLVIDDWHDHGATINNADVYVSAGKAYPVKLEYYENAGDAVVSMAWFTADEDLSAVRAAAKHADIAIVAVGFNENLEHEGGDRTFDLPSMQDNLINTVAAENEHTIVVLNAGGNVNMQSWLPNVKGLIHAWFPGQEGGTALARIISGKVNPSGKLPASFEKAWQDNPVHNNYYDADGDKRVEYKEGLYVGYRYWDTAPVKPQFPFGFGLSYTSFTYSDMKVTDKSGNGLPLFEVKFNLTNTGNYDGAEVAELYVHQQQTPVDRPQKELKGFSKIFLKKGEAKSVTMMLGTGAFSYYKEGVKSFGYDTGKFDIIIGSSSADSKLKRTIEVK